MSLNYWNAMNVAQNLGFQTRVKLALQKSAADVMAEDNTTPSHTARVTYAKLVLAGSASVFEATVAALTNSTLQTEGDVTATTASGFGISDSDLQFTINSLFNALAGVAT